MICKSDEFANWLVTTYTPILFYMNNCMNFLPSTYPLFSLKRLIFIRKCPENFSKVKKFQKMFSRKLVNQIADPHDLCVCEYYLFDYYLSCRFLN